MLPTGARCEKLTMVTLLKLPRRRMQRINNPHHIRMYVLSNTPFSKSGGTNVKILLAQLTALGELESGIRL